MSCAMNHIGLLQWNITTIAKCGCEHQPKVIYNTNVTGYFNSQ